MITLLYTSLHKNLWPHKVEEFVSNHQGRCELLWTLDCLRNVIQWMIENPKLIIVASFQKYFIFVMSTLIGLCSITQFHSPGDIMPRKDIFPQSCERHVLDFYWKDDEILLTVLRLSFIVVSLKSSFFFIIIFQQTHQTTRKDRFRCTKPTKTNDLHSTFRTIVL